MEGSGAVPKHCHCRGEPDNDNAEEWSDSGTRNVATDCGASGNARNRKKREKETGVFLLRKRDFVV